MKIEKEYTFIDTDLSDSEFSNYRCHPRDAVLPARRLKEGRGVFKQGFYNLKA
jgi:hypothetical protein